MISSKDFGKLICSRRMKLGWSQAKLAERLVVSARALRNWEHGITIPNFFDGLRCCRVLGIDPADLMTRR